MCVLTNLVAAAGWPVPAQPAPQGAGGRPAAAVCQHMGSGAAPVQGGHQDPDWAGEICSLLQCGRYVVLVEWQSYFWVACTSSPLIGLSTTERVFPLLVSRELQD